MFAPSASPHHKDAQEVIVGFAAGTDAWLTSSGFPSLNSHLSRWLTGSLRWRHKWHHGTTGTTTLRHRPDKFTTLDGPRTWYSVTVANRSIARVTSQWRNSRYVPVSSHFHASTYAITWRQCIAVYYCCVVSFYSRYEAGLLGKVNYTLNHHQTQSMSTSLWPLNWILLGPSSGHCRDLVTSVDLLVDDLRVSQRGQCTTIYSAGCCCS